MLPGHTGSRYFARPRSLHLKGRQGGAGGSARAARLVSRKSLLSMSDHDFIREVNEAVRQEKYKQLWDQYGLYVLALAVLLVAGVAGYNAWTFWRQNQAQTAGAEFTQAVTLAESADPKAKEFARRFGEERARRLSSARPLPARRRRGQGRQDRRRRRRLRCARQRRERRPDFEGRGRASGCQLAPRQGRLAEMERRLKPLVNSNSAWRYSARELLGLSAYKQNDMREAERQFSTLSAIRERRRACGSAQT